MRDFYSELAIHTGRNRDLIQKKCENAAVELAWAWEKYKTDPLKYYRKSDLYVFDLAFYQTLQTQRGTLDWYRNKIKEYQWKSMLDYGGGIGEWTLIPAEMGIESSYLDMKNSKTLKYAEWRFALYNIHPTILFDGQKLEKHYDFIVAMDVFEHIENPEPIIQDVCAHTNYIFANPEEIPYNFIYPQHISRYDLSKYCIHVDKYLWRVR